MAVVLVTGGAGFIGSHLVDELVRRGHDVTAFDDLSGGFAENVNPRASFVRGSVVHASHVDRLFAERKFDFVCHLAAYAAEGLSHFIKRFNYRNNLIGTVNLLNAAVNHRVRCFLFTSSMAVYGHAPCPMTEDTPACPADSYGIAKFAAEQELRVSRDLFGLNFVVFRPHNVYGERQNIGDRYRNVIGIFMNQIMQGQALTVFGDGLQQRAFSYVGDVVPVMAEALAREDTWNDVYNVGAEEPVAVIALAREVARAMNAEVRLRHLPPRDEVKDAWCSHDKVRRVFGMAPSVPLREGLARMAAWARAHGARRSRRFRNIEVRRNLPPSWLE